MPRARLLIMCLFALPPATALAQAGTAPLPELTCAPEVTAWVNQCAQAHGLTASTRFCPAGMAVVQFGPLTVEVSHNSGHPFRKVGAVGLSPVGEFPDWDRAAPAIRGAFDGLASCAAAADASLVAALDHPVPVPRPLRWPWRLAVAAALAILAWLLQRQQKVEWRVLAGLAALTAGTFLLRWLLIDPAFFHQHGHGAGWIDSARRQGPLHGPGFAELFGWIVYVQPLRQERAVFLANAVIGALLPMFVAAVARNSGARGWAVWAFAVIAATDPMLARVSLSESYFCATATFLMAAAALLGWAFRPGSGMASRIAAGLAAGMIVSQIARVHPNTWIPAAFVPLVVPMTPGVLWRRIVHTIISIAVIGLVVYATTGSKLLEVLHGPIGSSWTPSLAGPAIHLGIIAAVALALMVITVRLVPRSGSILVPIAVVAVTLGVFRFVSQHTIGGLPPVYFAATFSMFAAPVVAGFASLEFRAAGLLLTIALATLPFRWKSMTRVSTDEMEARAALRWRNDLPRDAEVWFLCYSDLDNFRLPLWPADFKPAPYVLGREMTLNELPEPPGELIDRGLAYYYRSYLCARPQGRKWCQQAEAHLDLEPVFQRELPAVESADIPFESTTVRTGLFRIRGLR